MSAHYTISRFHAALLLALLTGVFSTMAAKAGKGQNDPAPAQQQRLDISLIQLIANPEKYDGKQVRVFGFVRIEHEGSSIYLHREDYEQGLRRNGLWLHANDHAAPGSKEAAVNNHYALIEGKFVAKDHGHLGLWSGAITDITRLEPWPPQRPKQSAVEKPADPLKDAPRSEAFEANLNWHRQVAENEVRLSWFLRGEAGIAMICKIDLSRAESFYAREVHDHATQAAHVQKLGQYQTVTIRKVMKGLPPSAQRPALADLLLVTVREKGQPVTRVYNRCHLPLEIVRLYDISGAYVDTGKEE
jgi:hypothetical protein